MRFEEAYPGWNKGRLGRQDELLRPVKVLLNLIPEARAL
jgi:hypothetical protein